MKFIFFGPSKEIELLTQKFNKDYFTILDKSDEVLAKAKEGEALVFINYDFDTEQAKKVNEQVSGLPNIKKIVYSKTKDLRKENISADEFILGPLNKVSFENAYIEIMGGKTLTTFSLDQKEDPSKNIQEAFDAVFPDPAEKPKEEAKEEESNLQFTVTGMDANPQLPSEPEIPADVTNTPELSLGEAANTEEIKSTDLDIPSLDEVTPPLELGAQENTSPPPDEGLDLDLDASDATVISPPPSPVEPAAPPPQPEQIASDPSMKFTAVEQVPTKVEEESREFKFEVPKDQSTVSTEAAREKPSLPAHQVISRDESSVKLEAIIRSLREEREHLLKTINDAQEAKDRMMGTNLDLEATVEELKVELLLIKRRNEQQYHEEAFEKRMLKEKLALAEEKNKMLQKDLEILNQQTKIDSSKIMQREKELENQLEMLSIDSQNQLLSREKKIADLVREKDAIVFNLENLVSREKKIRLEKVEIEEKLNKIMKTLKNSVEFLEQEIQGNLELYKETRK